MQPILQKNISQSKIIFVLVQVGQNVILDPSDDILHFAH
jgi:hypothetical protein